MEIYPWGIASCGTYTCYKQVVLTVYTSALLQQIKLNHNYISLGYYVKDLSDNPARLYCRM